MGTTIRQQTINLMQILQNACRYHFVQLLRLLEHADVMQNYLLLPHQNLSFPATDVGYCNELEKKIALRFMGLFGVDAPLPSYFLCEAQRSSEEGDALRAFLNIFNHRIYQLLYRAWKRARLAILLEQGNNVYLHVLTFLSGGGLAINDKRELAAAGIMGQRIHSANGLQFMLQKFLSLNVTIHQFIPHWVTVQADYFLGKNFGLGNGMLGQRVLDLSSHILITIKAESLSQALTLLPYQPEGQRLSVFIKHYLGPSIQYHLCLVVKPEITLVLQLGVSNCYLGYQSWLGVMSQQGHININC